MVSGFVSSATEKGARSYQEDRFVVIRHETHEEKGWLIAVMDGHGGSEVAEFCEQTLESKFRTLADKSKNIQSIYTINTDRTGEDACKRNTAHVRWFNYFFGLYF